MKHASSLLVATLFSLAAFAQQPAPRELVELVRALPKPAGTVAVTQTTASGMPMLYRRGAEALRDRPALKDKAKSAFEIYLRDAEAGDAIARASVARMYDAGSGTARDPKRGFDWALRAAEQGETTAQTSVAVAYARGESVPRNDAEAFRWASVAAEHGEAVAWSQLGVLYKLGRGTPRDLAKSLECLHKAADAGEPYSILNLADAYRFGYGVPRDPQQAMELEMKAIGIFRASAGDEAALTEDARRFLVQAQAAIRERQFTEAEILLRKATDYAPWSPMLYYNRALVEAELQRYDFAVWGMEIFLALAPAAPQARGAQDLIYEWERKLPK